jgi:hypothetical protein
MTGEAFPDRPPKPRLTLRVGVTGKRLIPAGKEKDIRASLDGILGRLSDFLTALHQKDSNFFSLDLPLLRVICGMAEGADQLAADIVSKRFASEVNGERDKPGSRTIETRLAAILPFEQSEFRKDFWDDPARRDGPKRTDVEAQPIVANFDRLVHDSMIETILEIDDEALLRTGQKDHRSRAYANLGEVLLAHADILIALSDDQWGGVGGTMDVIRDAQSLRLPTINISTITNEIHVLAPPEWDDPFQRPLTSLAISAASPLPESLLDELRDLVSPSAALSHRSPSDASAPAYHRSRPALKRLDDFLREPILPMPKPRLFKALRDGLTAWPRPPDRPPGILYLLLKVILAFPRFFRAIWAAVRGFLSTRRVYEVETPENVLGRLKKRWQLPAVVSPDFKPAGAIHARRYAWADALAVRYADRTRSYYISIAACGALAVLIGLFAVWFTDDRWTPIKIVVLLAEGGLLYWAGKHFYEPAHHESWHERMVEYRVLAELLRHQRFVYALGTADRKEAVHGAASPDSWVRWYAHATQRELGFPGIRLDAPYRKQTIEQFQSQEIDGQINYNDGLARTFFLLDDRLVWVIQWAWIITIAIAAVGAAALGALLWFKLRGSPSAEFWIHALKPTLTVLMAFIPAAIAAVHGVRFQMEFRSTAERAEATQTALKSIRDELAVALERPHGIGRNACVYFVRKANQAMGDDVSGWAAVYKGKAAEPPG